MKFWRHAAAAVLMAVAAGLLIWRGQDASAPAGAAAGAIADPGYIATDAEIIQTGPDGQPLYRLQARRVEQSQAGTEIHVVEPRLTYQQGSGPEWSLRADTGVLPPDADRADLTGSVYAVATRPDAVPLEIRTDHLGIDMDRQLVTTSDPVRIAWGRDQVTAVGLRADLKADTLRLESRVHGEITR
jgi:lipopolysaccharide export system protein LptC